MLEWQSCTQLHHLIRGFYKSLPLKSWNTAVSTNISHCCDRTTNIFLSCVGNRFMCHVLLLQKSSSRVLLLSSVCKNVPSDFAFPKHLLFICQNRANKTNTALSISIIPLIKAIFGLSGLEFCQKLQICMPNLLRLITHFGQKSKNPPPKCPSRITEINHAVEKAYIPFKYYCLLG